jgi:hypothetical protein
MSTSPTKRFWVCGVDTFAAFGPHREDARYALGSFDTFEEAETFALERAARPHAADPALCDAVEIHDRENGVVAWGRQRPPKAAE